MNAGVTRAIFALAGMLIFVPRANADPFSGKTLFFDFAFSVAVCPVSSSECRGGQVARSRQTGRVYVGTKGRIFDFTRTDGGDTYRLGETSRTNARNTRFAIRGNSLVRYDATPQFTVALLHTLVGGRCVVSANAKSLMPGVRISVAIDGACHVRDGNFSQ